MKSNYWICLIITIFGCTLSNAQVLDSCYIKNMNKGKSAQKRGDYRSAINSFIYARWCPKAITNGEVDRQINQTLKIWVDSLNLSKHISDSLRIETEKQNEIVKLKSNEIIKEKNNAIQSEAQAQTQKKLAQFNSRLFYGYFVADEALEDLKKEELKLQGFAKAFHAYDTLMQTNTPIPPSVYKTLGKAIFINFGEKITNHPGGFIDIAYSKELALLGMIGRDSSVSILNYELDENRNLILPNKSGFDILKYHIRDTNLIISSDFDFWEKELVYVDRKNNISQVSLLDKSRIDLLFQAKHDAPIVKIKYLPGGKILSAGRDGKVILWDKTGEFIKTLIEDDLPIVDLNMAQNGEFISARTMRTVYYWSRQEEEKLDPIVKVEENALVYTTALSNDGGNILISTSNNRVHLFTESEKEQTIEVPAPVFSLKFAPNQEAFLICPINGAIQLYKKEKFNWKNYTYSFSSHVSSLSAISESASYYLAVDFDNTICILSCNQNPENRLEAVLVDDHDSRITSLVFSPNSDSIFLSTSEDGMMKLWLTNGKLIMDLDFGNSITHSIFLDDGNYILSGTSKGEVYICPTTFYIYEKIKKGELRLQDIRTEVKQNINHLLGRQNQ